MTRYLTPMLAITALAVVQTWGGHAEAQDMRWIGPSHRDLPDYLYDADSEKCIQAYRPIGGSDQWPVVLESPEITLQSPKMNMVGSCHTTYSLDASVLVYKTWPSREGVFYMESTTPQVNATINLDCAGFGPGEYDYLYFLTDGTTHRLVKWGTFQYGIMVYLTMEPTEITIPVRDIPCQDGVPLPSHGRQAGHGQDPVGPSAEFDAGAYIVLIVLAVIMAAVSLAVVRRRP